MKLVALYDPITVEAATWDTLADVASRMRFNDVGSAAVMSDGKLVGIITEKDFTRAIADGADTRQETVDQYMTVQPITVNMSADAREAARIMLEHGIRHLPVVDDAGRFVGLTSVRDILVELAWTTR